MKCYDCGGELRDYYYFDCEYKEQRYDHTACLECFRVQVTDGLPVADPSKREWEKRLQERDRREKRHS